MATDLTTAIAIKAMLVDGFCNREEFEPWFDGLLGSLKYIRNYGLGTVYVI